MSPVRHRSDRVVAQDHEQALDPGKPRLGVIVVGFFREIDDRPFWRFGRFGRAEVGLLARRAAARIGNFEITVADAKIGIAVLRQRRGAINGRRARVQINHIGVERPVHHLPALAGIEVVPAARDDICALFDADRRFHAEAGAVAQCQFRPRLRGRQHGNRRGDQGDETVESCRSC